MSVYSFLFLILAAAAAVIYHFLPQKIRAIWLLIISAGFVASWSWQFVLVLALFGLANFAIGIKIEQSDHRQRWKIVGIVFNILFLFFLKYSSFYLPALQNLLQRLGLDKRADALTILVPIGLSFLMVQCISYLLDVYNKRLKAERDLIKFGVYIFYFPKLLSGPVERARVLLQRFDKPQQVNRVLLEKSAGLLLIGLFRKLAIADVLFSMIPANAFVTPQNYVGQHLFFWFLAYSFALFNDFAGYTLIVRGVSLWFGIELTKNFTLPYFSHNFTEFWNRWHISLSNWLRDYIFFPLSRSLMRRFPERNHVLNIVLPPLVTMAVSGLWHGLSWNLLVWGGLHGMFLVLERVLGIIKPTAAPEETPAWRRLFGTALTFTLVSLLWIPFKMSLPVSWQFFTGLFKWVKPDFFLFERYLKANTEVLSWSPLNLPNPLLLTVLVVAVCLDLLLKNKTSEKNLSELPRWVQVAFIVIVFIVITLSAFSDTSAPFVYQGF